MRVLRANRTGKRLTPNASARLGDDALHHLAAHVGEAVVAAAEAVGELRVVHAEKVEHRGVEIVNGDLVLDREVAVLIRGAVGGTALDAASGQPDGEAERIVVAPVGALGHGGAAELAG